MRPQTRPKNDDSSAAEALKATMPRARASGRLVLSVFFLLSGGPAASESV